jgi:hypothetical protein
MFTTYLASLVAAAIKTMWSAKHKTSDCRLIGMWFKAIPFNQHAEYRFEVESHIKETAIGSSYDDELDLIDKALCFCKVAMPDCSA